MIFYFRGGTLGDNVSMINGIEEYCFGNSLSVGMLEEKVMEEQLLKNCWIY
jgi:hypothetical protein